MKVAKTAMDLFRTTERNKTLKITPVSEALVRFRATLEDRCETEGETEAEIIHSLILEGTISLPDLVVQTIEPTVLRQPHPECVNSVEPMRKLVGLRVGPGFRDGVIKAVGRTLGCTHFMTLALDLAASHTLALFLRMRTRVPFEKRNTTAGAWIGTGLEIEPRLENACIALQTHSDTIQSAKAFLQRE